MKYELIMKAHTTALSPGIQQEVPGAGVSALARAHAQREGQERLSLCHRLSGTRGRQSSSCCHQSPHPPCLLTSHPVVDDRCLSTCAWLKTAVPVLALSGRGALTGHPPPQDFTTRRTKLTIKQQNNTKTKQTQTTTKILLNSPLTFN